MAGFALSFRAPRGVSQRLCAVLAAWLVLLAAVTAGAATEPAAEPATDAARIQVYQQFRQAFDARRYPEALPLAEKLVALTESQLGAEDKALVNPLANLGTVQYRLQNFPAAETAYQRSLAIAEAKATAAVDRSLIKPLHGLGEVYLATKRYEVAAVVLDRAVDLTRNLEGLYHVSQLEILPALIESYVGLFRLAEAEKEHQYAFRVAETAYGRNDKRLLGSIDRYARWYEYIGRYTTARVLHARGLQIAEREGGTGSLLSVRPLRGLSRTYWLEFIYGPEEAEDASTDPFGAQGQASNTAPGGARMNPDGEKALRIAVDTLNKQQPIDRLELGETLLDLGDWYQIAGSPSKALDTYRAAFTELNAINVAAKLATPLQLAYRAPASSTLRARPSKPEEYEERSAELRLTIGRDGRVLDAVGVGGDAPDASIRSVVIAVKRARYRPRIEAEGPVEAKDVPFTERLLLRKSATPAPAAAPTPAATPNT
jgi:tetratricopeptide (TPR) repeat protein